MGAQRTNGPQLIVRYGRPAGVILGIQEYERILERLEDADDLKALRRMRQKPLKFRKLEDFLREQPRRV